MSALKYKLGNDINNLNFHTYDLTKMSSAVEPF